MDDKSRSEDKRDIFSLLLRQTHTINEKQNVTCGWIRSQIQSKDDKSMEIKR